MNFNPDIHHRRSIRLKGYDYSQPAAYFVTICTQDREFLFGEVINGVIRLNDSGEMVSCVWQELSEKYSGICADEFIVMPNHFHGIVFLNVGAGPCARPQFDADGGPPRDVGAGPRACPDRRPIVVHPKGHPQDTMKGPQGGAPTLSLPDVCYRFKSLTTFRYRNGVLQNGWPPFPGKLWQRNYYEHIIRNDDELIRIREYILQNPMKWELDSENPNAVIHESFEPWKGE